MEGKYPKISVLMPVYNAERFIREAIDSILNQTFRNFEFIIINDASADSSKNIILSYNDKRIRYFENDNNLGVARTLNRGLKLARADLVARMDADDISYPNRLEMQYKMIEKDKEIVVLASIFDVVDERGKFLYTEKYDNSPEEIYYTLRFRNCLGHPTVMFRKRIILNVFNGYDINHEAEDYDLWLRISSKYKISKINTSLLKLRTSINSRMGASGRKIDNDATFIAKKNLELLTGETINLDIVEILKRNFATFRSSLSTVFSKEEIRRIIIILEKINNGILNHHPIFLKKCVLKKILLKNYNSLKYDLCLTTLFDFKFGFLLKYLFRVYSYFKLNLVRDTQSQE